MKQQVRDIARKLSPSVFAFLKGVRLLVDKNSFLVTSGLIHSYKEDIPCRPDGSPLPWMNYNVIAFLEDRLNKSQILFEYGCGYSTRFYASRVSRVVSVESDPHWYSKIKDDVPTNVELEYCPLEDGRYCRSILDTGLKYDVVVVDGRERVRCAGEACQALSPRGVILFDDSQREQYRPGIAHLLDAGFKKLDFIGFKPTGIEMDQTSIFYRSGNCFGI